MPTTYCVEKAKSNRSKCSVCKTKIEKGELRIGSTSMRDDVAMTRWKKPLCMNKPKAFASVDAFLEAVEGFDALEESEQEEIRQQVSQKKARKRKASAMDAGEMPSAIKALKVRAKQEPFAIEELIPEAFTQTDGDVKIKVEGKTKEKAGFASLPPKGDSVRIYLQSEFPTLDPSAVLLQYSFRTRTNDQLKEILRWNYQLLGGTKDDLVNRCMGMLCDVVILGVN